MEGNWVVDIPGFLLFFFKSMEIIYYQGMVKMDFYGYSYPSIETIVKKNFVLEIGARRKFGNENGS